MKISLEWIGDYVELPRELRADQIMHDLTMATVEVESATTMGERLTGYVVGRVDSDAGGAAVTCDIGGGRMVRCATGGVVLPNGRLVAIRPGATGEGVLGDARTLGLEDLFGNSGGGPIALDDASCHPGDDLGTVLAWNDTVLEIDNKSLTNRPDLWGHYGVARELAAIYGRPLKPLPPRPVLPEGRLVGSIDESLCHRFTATHITGVRVEAAPFWVRSRLARIGQRPVNVWVDLTNYVMLAVGQPSHAFDGRRLTLPLGTRRGQRGETVRLLNDEDYPVDVNVLVVTDANGPVSVAGIMGGASTAVSDDTTDIVLECASFDALAVRRASRQLNVRTDASARFEKAIDTERVDVALGLFLSLLGHIQPGAAVTGFDDRVVRVTERKQITTAVRFFDERLGTALGADEIGERLRAFGFSLEHRDGTLHVLTPVWRSTGDVSGPFDLLEEVARLKGYDSLPFVPAHVQLVEHATNIRALFERRVRDLVMLSGGMREVVTYPWSRARFLEAAGFDAPASPRLLVAPGADQHHLRPSLVPNLIETIAQNIGLFESFRIFEIGRVFPGGVEPAQHSGEALPRQPRHLAGAFVGPDARVLFRELQGLLEALPRVAHAAPLTWTGTAAAWADASAALGITTGDETIGHLGVLTKRARRLAGIRRGAVAMFELNLDGLVPLPSRENRYVSLAEYPQADFDVSLVFADAVSWQSIREAARTAHDMLRDVVFVDEFRGRDVPAGHKSVTLRLRIGVPGKTLRAEEISEVAKAVTAKLSSVFAVQLRSANQ